MDLISRKVKILIITVIILALGVGIFLLAKGIIKSGYDSMDIVEVEEELLDVPENSQESSSESELNSDISGTETSDVESQGDTISSESSQSLQEDQEGYASLEDDTEHWKGSVDDTILQACKEILLDSPHPELADQIDTFEVTTTSNDDYEVKAGDYYIGFYKNSLAFRYIKKSSNFTEEEIQWLSPDGDTQWFTEEDGFYVFR